MAEERAKEIDHHQVAGQQPLVWYCPSRWLLAHHDQGARISTMSSHICLADMNNDGESLLALIDFRRQRQASEPTADSSELTLAARAPYECRLRVYRGQQLIYNHFLDDIPANLIVASVSLPTVSRPAPTSRARLGAQPSQQQTAQQQQQQPLLTMPINDDVYFYHKLRPSHKLSLEDEECVLDSLNRSEVDAWQMVKQNKVDTETMRELLASLSQELGSHELTSHSQNFVALRTGEQRRQYLVAWRLKRLQQQGANSSSELGGYGEQIMSMDTICCSAARLKHSSSITRSGDYGHTRDKNAAVLLMDGGGGASSSARWNRILDIQKDGLLLGTEDRHLLIYELRAIRTRLECHYRLRATPDHILVERRSPASFDAKQDLRALTYKILVSCRNCRVYAIDQLYLVGEQKAAPCEVTELVALKSNVLDMSWTGLDETDSAAARGSSGPCFVLACLDRRLYCFGSQSGHCKWIIELELPITCLTCLPKLQVGAEESSLIGVATRANRIDFYVASNGRIVDSIYFNQDEFPQAMVFGRFGREDNCLCLVTSSGALVVLILKRTAKFAHGQCLSSAASYAAQTLSSCRELLRDSSPNSAETEPERDKRPTESGLQQSLRLDEKMDLPSAFALSKSNTSATDQMIESILHSNHHCDQSALKGALDAHSARPRLQIPVKSREFVAQILDQSRESRQTSRVFAENMIRLREKVRASLEQHQASVGSGPLDGRAPALSGHGEGNRLVLTRVLGLGNTYRIELALRLNVEKFVERHHELLLQDSGRDSADEPPDQEWCWWLKCLLRPRASNMTRRLCQVQPFKVEIATERDDKAKFLVRPTCETSLEAKLTVLGPVMEPAEGESVPLDVQIFAYHRSARSITPIQRPFLLTSVNIPLMTS